MNPDSPVEFLASSGEPRNHNKKHRQDEDPLDSGGRPSPEITVIPGQPSSYKDTLLGDCLKQTIVIKILGRRIGYATIRNKLYEAWKPAQDFKLMDIENDYFLVTFRSHAHYLHVLADGPWTMFSHYVSVEPWTEDFSTTQPYPSNIVAWIHLPGLPVTLYKCSLVIELGECIGRVLKLDYQTETGRQGMFARMAIRVNLNKPLVSKIMVNGRIQLVEYDSLPTICFHCGKYGHVTDNYPDLQPNHATEVPEQPSVPMPEPPTTMFGCWMVVERHQHRPQLKASVGKGPSTGVVISESHFAPILDANTNEANTNDIPPLAHASSDMVKDKPSTSAQHSVAFNVRKPLQLNLKDLSILHRSGHKAGSSNHSSSSKNVSHLDKSRHSSITLPENSDPNIQLHVPSQLMSNLNVEPPKKPPDPTDTVNTSVHAQETMHVDVHNDLFVDAHAMITDGYDVATLE
ncbi:hypothetical protein V6N12_002353 [Hibiscus sabdariffa]|uniref:DUF4283 domain-containing protein n=1 Tax=Hibiscus sabdariffa TaxID=183260 RepID=A0ABR2AL53_9ROSI